MLGLSPNKACTNCGLVKARSEYNLKSGWQGEKGYIYPFCRACAPEVKERYYKKARGTGSHRAGHYRRTFGITLEDYRDRFEKQEGLCAVCRCPETRNRLLAIDHDHANGTIRGLLCSACNTAIGLMKEQPKVLKAAIEYLEKF